MRPLVKSFIRSIIVNAFMYGAIVAFFVTFIFDEG